MISVPPTTMTNKPYLTLIRVRDKFCHEMGLNRRSKYVFILSTPNFRNKIDDGLDKTKRREVNEFSP